MLSLKDHQASKTIVKNNVVATSGKHTTLLIIAMCVVRGMAV